MDKHEYRTKTEQMLAFAEQGRYQEAMHIADMIDWSKVKNTAVLCVVSEIYEKNDDFRRSRDILFLAYDRSPESKKVIYRLAVLALKLGEIKEANDCYEEFVTLAPKDPNRLVLQYKLLKEQKAPLRDQIDVLENLKKIEYVEKWAFELAKLYHAAGMTSECIEECDDLVLWFSEGKYVYRAMDLKMLYKPLTPMQQEKYNMREKEPATEEPTAEEPAAEEPTAEESVVEEPAVEEPVTEEVDEVAEAVETLEEKKETPTLSIEEMLQGWEEKQKENAQMILDEIEKAEAEKAQEEVTAVVEEAEETAEEILPDDIRQLMEELESESDSIEAQKTKAEEPEVIVPIPVPVEEPVSAPIVEEVSMSDVEALEAVVSHKYDPNPELDENSPGIKLGNTDSMAAVAKALKNNVEVSVLEETPTEMPSAPVQDSEPDEYDTGFIVQGRYDLDAQSEVGTKAGLTEEQKKLFSYFVPVRGMSEQIVEVLDYDRRCKSRYGTSRIGNVLIIGRKGSGKTVLAVNIVKAIQKSRKAKAGKVGIVAADSLNKKNVAEIMGKLHGGAIIVEKASRLSRKTIEDMCEVMEGQTGELLVVLEDERKPMEEMLASYPQFEKKFTSRLEVPVFINDELVTFGQTYAKENGYKIDEMGILALYSRIDIIQRDEKVVTVTDVKSIVDEAIENSQKISMKKVFKVLLNKNKDDSDRILLREEDFR